MKIKQETKAYILHVLTLGSILATALIWGGMAALWLTVAISWATVALYTLS